MVPGLIFAGFNFENFIKQLVKIEDEKEKLLETYFPRPSKERGEAVSLLNNYLETIDDFIKGNQVSKAEFNIGIINEFPFVIVDSLVEVLELSNQKTLQYRIVHPFSNEITYGDVTFISPIGKALLLKKVGDKVRVCASGGLFNYQIKSIKLDKSLLS